MKKLFLLLCITAAVLIAGHAHAAYKVSSKGVFTWGCRGPVVYGGIYSSFDQFKGQTFSNCTTKISKVSQGSETHVAFFGDYNQVYAQFQLVAAECPEGTVPDNQTGACVPDESSCESRKAQDSPGIGTIPDDGKAITATRYYCDVNTMCEAQQSYSASNGSLIKNNFYTGNDCVGSEEDYDETPWYQYASKDPLPEGCTHDLYTETGGYFCNKDTNGDGNPDLESDLDVDAVCDYDSDGHFSCSGGSYDKPFESPDPTNPIDETPDFEGGAGSNPNPIETTTPPDVDDTPAPEGSDEGVIAAVRNLNSNLSQALTTQTNKNVEGFNTVNQQLAELKQTNTKLGQTIVEQMRQDKEIYDNTKALIQGSTNSMVNSVGASATKVQKAVKHAEDGIVKATEEGADSVKASVEAGTEQLDGSINALGGKLDELTAAVSGAASTICNPNKDPRSCEGNHGLTQPQVADMFNQMKYEMDAQVSAGESNLKNTMQHLVDNPKMTEGHDLIQSLTDDLIGVLPNSDTCVDMPLQTPLGTFSLGCEFSERIKAILAFMFYVYTLYSLVEILFTGFTPVAGTVPYMSRR